MNTRLLAATSLAVLASLAGCVTDNMLDIDVGEVGVEPAAVSLPQNDSVQLAVVVRDGNGAVVQNVPVVWGVNPPSVASVSATGVVRGLQAGPAIVTATFAGVSGSSAVTVLGGPNTLVADPDSLTIVGEAGGSSPPTARVDVSADDPESLRDLEATVSYAPGAPDAWATLDYSPSSGPVEVEVRSGTSGMSAGRYAATLLLSTADNRTSPVGVPLVLVLASLEVTESAGGTLLRGKGARDTLMVSLGARPDHDVVVEVEVEDDDVAKITPKTLTFTAGDWNAPRAVVLTGERLADFNRDQATKVRIEVDDGQSDPIYRNVGRVEVDVATGLFNGVLPVGSGSGG